MEIFAIIRITFLIASLATFILSLIFLLSPDTYVRLENMLNMDVINRIEFLSSIEGKVEVLNEWILENRVIFGLLFVLLSLYNIKSLILL